MRVKILFIVLPRTKSTTVLYVQWCKMSRNACSIRVVLRKVGKTFMEIDFIHNTKLICLEVTPYAFANQIIRC